MSLISQDIYYRSLLHWSLINLLLGLAFVLEKNLFLQGFGLSNIFFGTIGVIGTIIIINKARKKFISINLPLNEKEEGAMYRLAKVCFAIFIVGAIIIIASLTKSLYYNAIGFGFIFQSVILFCFDLSYGGSGIKKMSEVELNLFQGPEHKEFILEGGKPAALLIHSFTGTPRQMLDVGTLFQQGNWTVQGLLLPGFGPNFSKMAQYNHKEWLGAIQKSVSELKKKHEPVILIGYSSSSALCINAAASSSVDGLVIIEPLILPEGLMEKVTDLFLPGLFQPFLHANFSDPELQKDIKKLLPHLDIDDKNVTDAIRQFTLPATIIGEIKKGGYEAHNNAGNIRKPVLIIESEKEKPEEIENIGIILKDISGKVDYKKINSSQDIISKENQKWPEIKKSLLEFGEKIKK